MDDYKDELSLRMLYLIFHSHCDVEGSIEDVILKEYNDMKYFMHRSR